MSLIDLHTHTNESDGTFTPAELVAAAGRAALRSFAITDHDTFAGYLQAREPAIRAGLDLICGIEVSSRYGRQAIHILGYFLRHPPPDDFVAWLRTLAAERENRNRELANRLAKLGVDVTVEEAQSLGRSITGRVHFARVMMQKGYARSIQDAFNRYIGDAAPAYVEANDPPVEVVLQRLATAGALPVVAHLGRYRIHPAEQEESFVAFMKDAGLGGVEAIHTDHDETAVARYAGLAAKYDLLLSGGSDYHGEAKPGVRLGYGNFGKIPIPDSWLDRMRERS